MGRRSVPAGLHFSRKLCYGDINWKARILTFLPRVSIGHKRTDVQNSRTEVVSIGLTKFLLQPRGHVIRMALDPIMQR